MLKVICGDALTELIKLPNECVQCCVTSPPYWGLRDYGTAQWEGGDAGCDHKQTTARHDGGRVNTDGFHGSAREDSDKGAMNYAHLCGKCGARRIDSQFGLEKTPEEYVAKMVEVFREVRRVLRKDGTLWLNLGDSYWGSGKGLNGDGTHSSEHSPTDKQFTNKGSLKTKQGDFKTLGIEIGLKPKDLCGIPWRVAFALQADGWWLRSDIIWAKPNPMPESVTDRPTKIHEYLFLLSKSANYFYDAEAIKESSDYVHRRSNGATSRNGTGRNDYDREVGDLGCEGSRNKRSVWTVTTAPYPEAHFATYPPDLIKPCILAGTSAKGCCDKCGSPWERIVDSKSISRDELPPDDPRYRPHRYDDKSNGRDQRKPNAHRFHESQTIGWQPTCKCDAETIPCTVLDPFAGSGTTGAVALELGRKAVLIELNPKYIELIRQRCDVTPGLALA